MPKQVVKQLMRQPAVVCPPEASVREVADLMVSNDVSSVVVVDEGGVLKGILTERDVIEAGDYIGKSASDLMTVGVLSLDADESASIAWGRLIEAGHRRAAVTEDGLVVGVLSRTDLTGLARISDDESLAPAGLEGVIASETSVGDVRGREGFFHYRQYSALDLARARTVEDVWHLMFNGELPNAAEAEAFSAEVRSKREVRQEILDQVKWMVDATPEFVPLNILRTALSLYAEQAGFKPTIDIDADAIRENAIKMCAVTPTLIAAISRFHSGESAIAPDPNLGFGENYLYMLSGRLPEARFAAAIEKYLILTIDHGFNSSTFTGRVVTSTGADVGAAVVAALGALTGPLHGGAPSRALDMLDAIGEPENTDAWVRNAVEHGERIMGFGHRVYKTDDPRSLLLREVALELGGPLADFAVQAERSVVDILAELKPGRNLYTNVEFFAGVVMDQCGIDRRNFTPTFTASRVIGWCTHIMEQAAKNRLIRPSSLYIGPEPPQPVPALPA